MPRQGKQAPGRPEDPDRSPIQRPGPPTAAGAARLRRVLWVHVSLNLMVAGFLCWAWTTDRLAFDHPAPSTWSIAWSAGAPATHVLSFATTPTWRIFVLHPRSTPEHRERYRRHLAGEPVEEPSGPPTP